jgi:hypothetical protein
MFEKKIFFCRKYGPIVTLNVATLKNIQCIPIVCKYFIFVVSMEMRGKNQSHVAARYLR